MLRKEPRDLTGQPQTRSEIEAIFEEENCPFDHPIVPFQLTLGGYKMRGYGCYLLLGFTDDSSIYQKKGNWYCEFAEIVFPPSSPSSLIMDEIGILYCDASNIPLATSIWVYVESKALEEDTENSLGSSLYAVGGEGQIKISLGDISKLGKSLIALGLEEVMEASDSFEHWWVSSDCYVHVFRIWYSSESTVIVMANNVERLKELRTAFAGIAEFPPRYYLRQENIYYSGKFDSNSNEEPKLIEWPKPYELDTIPFYNAITRLSSHKTLREIINKLE